MRRINLSGGVELRDIPDSPNQDYMAGSDGRVYSRTRYAGFGKKVYVDWYPLVGCNTVRGYLSISMCHLGRKVTRNVHRLICQAFHGVPEPVTLQTRHLNGNRTDNRPENLAWGTQYENWQDRKAHGRGCEGEKHPMSKFTNAERECIRWAVIHGLCSEHHAARVLGVTQACICRMVHTPTAT